MKSGNLNFLDPLGHSRPVTGLLYLLYMPVELILMGGEKKSYVSSLKKISSKTFGLHCVFNSAGNQLFTPFTEL